MCIFVFLLYIFEVFLQILQFDNPAACFDIS